MIETQTSRALTATIRCCHSSTVIEASGSVFFSGGDVIDTLEERLYCLDCGEYVEIEPEPELLYLEEINV